jgi:hypothetical protein
MVCNFEMDKGSLLAGDPPRWPQRPLRSTPPSDWAKNKDEEHRRRAAGAILTRLDGHWLLAP